MSPESYYFGTRLAVRCDYYAFPRTGSHYLWACLTGVLDLVFYPNHFVDNPEARQRAEELNPHAYYALRLREDGVPFQPVYINASPQGTHGVPAAGEWPSPRERLGAAVARAYEQLPRVQKRLPPL